MDPTTAWARSVPGSPAALRSPVGRSWPRLIGLWLGVTVAAPGLAGSAPRPLDSPEPARGAPGRLAKLSLAELMELEVTSVSRRPEKLSEVASAIQVVTGEEIRRSTATTLPQAMRLADNLNVAQKNSHDWAITARGFNTALANKLLVLIDGRTVYTPLFSGVFWNVQDVLLEDIDRIEVISGPGGSVWGANAVNGVINVVSKPASETQGLFVETGGGAQPRAFAGARYGGKLGAASHYRVYGKYFSASAEQLANGADAGDDWRRAAGGFRLDTIAGARDRFTLQGDVYHGADGLTTGGDARVEGGNLVGRWTRTPRAGSELSLQLYYDWTRLRLPVPALIINSMPFAPAGELRDALDTCDLDSQHRFRATERQTLTWGLGFRYWNDAVDNAPALAFLPPNRHQSLWSGFVQDELSLSATSSLTLGTKVEHNGYTGLEFEPSVRLQFAPSSEQTLWAAVSRAVRTPSRIDREISQPAPPNLVILSGGEDFESEQVVATELGYRRIFADQAILSLAVFYNDYDNVRSTRTTPGTILPFVFANDLEGETYGLELVAKLQPTERWRLHVGYTLLEEDLRVRPGGEDFNAALNETADPRQQWSLRSALDLPGGVAVDAALRWVDAIHVNNGPTLGRVPSYLELDLNLGWRLTRDLSLAVAGQNLLHAHHPEYGFPSPVRVEIQRAVTGSLTWRR